MVVLSEVQFAVLMQLVRGERVTALPPITRRWLQRRGYVTVQRVNGGHLLEIQITDLGREVITTAVRKVKS